MHKVASSAGQVRGRRGLVRTGGAWLGGCPAGGAPGRWGCPAVLDRRQAAGQGPRGRRGPEKTASVGRRPGGRRARQGSGSGPPVILRRARLRPALEAERRTRATGGPAEDRGGRFFGGPPRLRARPASRVEPLAWPGGQCAALPRTRQAPGLRGRCTTAASARQRLHAAGLPDSSSRRAAAAHATGRPAMIRLCSRYGGLIEGEAVPRRRGRRCLRTERHPVRPPRARRSFRAPRQQAQREADGTRPPPCRAASDRGLGMVGRSSARAPHPAAPALTGRAEHLASLGGDQGSPPATHFTVAG